MILNVQVTKSDFIFDFGDFQVFTPKIYPDEIDKLEWCDGCLMIDTVSQKWFDSIGLYNLMFGEAPLYTPNDYTLIGRDSLSEVEAQNYIDSIIEMRWI